jgi:hypothetical protein
MKPISHFLVVVGPFQKGPIQLSLLCVKKKSGKKGCGEKTVLMRERNMLIVLGV